VRRSEAGVAGGACAAVKSPAVELVVQNHVFTTRRPCPPRRYVVAAMSRDEILRYRALRRLLLHTPGMPFVRMREDERQHMEATDCDSTTVRNARHSVACFCRFQVVYGDTTHRREVSAQRENH